MKRLITIFTALTVALLCAATAFAASPAVKLAGGRANEGEIFYADVSLSGCEGLTSADLRFEYDPAVLTFLGATLQGAAAGDEDFIAVFSEPSDAAENGYVALSFFHLDALSAEEGDGPLCQLAFRAGKGSSAVKAAAQSFMIGDDSVEPSLGRCKYSAGLGSFFKQYGSVVLICAVALLVCLVLIVLLIVVRKMKKNSPVNVEPFGLDEGDNPEGAPTVALRDPAAEDADEAEADAEEAEADAEEAEADAEEAEADAEEAEADAEEAEEDVPDAETADEGEPENQENAEENGDDA